MHKFLSKRVENSEEKGFHNKKSSFIYITCLGSDWHILMYGGGDMGEEQIIKILPQSLRKHFGRVQEAFWRVRQIRLRVNMPAIVELSEGEFYLGMQGEFLKDSKEAWIVRKEDVEAFMDAICGYSPYAFYEELKKGYITVPGGHRIGVAGQVVVEGERIIGIKNICFINIRISHEIVGAADCLIPFLYEDGQLLNTLIVSPPGFGKTTILRDLVRQISSGNKMAKGVSVGVVDERSELAGCCLGVPQNQVGERTDVLDGCPKRYGMMMLIRSMSPKVVAIDELGSKEDVEELKRVVHCGSRIIVTIHGESFEEIQQKPFARELVEEKYFQRYVVLQGVKDGRQSFCLLNQEGELCLK